MCRHLLADCFVRSLPLLHILCWSNYRVPNEHRRSTGGWGHGRASRRA